MHHDRCATHIDRALRCTCERERNYDASDHAEQIGMAFGAAAQNDARGWGSYDPGPCGHHCPWNCPSCGEGTVVFTKHGAPRAAEPPVVHDADGWNFPQIDDLEDYL